MREQTLDMDREEIATVETASATVKTDEPIRDLLAVELAYVGGGTASMVFQ